METKINEAIQAELKYIDEMDYGESSTTAFIMEKLGYKLDFMDMFAVEMGVYKEVEKTRDYVMDKSSHDGKEEGWPFHLDFVKMKR